MGTSPQVAPVHGKAPFHLHVSLAGAGKVNQNEKGGCGVWTLGLDFWALDIWGLGFGLWTFGVWVLGSGLWGWT